MFPQLTADEYLAALDDEAYTILGEASVLGPPIDAMAVAARLGLVVARDHRQAGRARLVRLAGGDPTARTAILLAAEPRFERQQFAVAHEIGEFCAHRVFERLGTDPAEIPPAARESVANHLAARLLLPTDWLAVAALACDWDLAQLKGRFATASYELVARRMLDFSPAVVVTVFDQEQRTWRQANLWGRVPRLTPLECQAWLAAHQSGQAEDAIDAGGRVRVWPIHEPEWKREIIRYEPALDETEDEREPKWLLHDEVDPRHVEPHEPVG